MDANRAFWAHFLPSSCWFFPKIVCNFAFKAQIFDICTWCGKIFTLAVENHIKPKRGDILSSRSKGGVGVSPREFLKNECKWCILSPFLPIACWFPPPKLCIILSFKALISDIRDAGEFFSFRMGRGGGPPRVFIWKTDANDALWVHS